MINVFNDFTFIATSSCFTRQGAQRLRYRVSEVLFLHLVNLVTTSLTRPLEAEFCTMNDPRRGTNIFETEYNRLNIVRTKGTKSDVLSIFAICEVIICENFTEFNTNIAYTKYLNSSNVQLNRLKT